MTYFFVIWKFCDQFSNGALNEKGHRDFLGFWDRSKNVIYFGSLGSKNLSSMSHQKRIFGSKSKIWPQMTAFDLEVMRPYLRPKFMSMELVDFLEILNNSSTRNENFDRFFDLKEPEYNIFGQKHSKITVFHFIWAPRPKSSLTKMLHKIFLGVIDSVVELLMNL